MISDKNWVDAISDKKVQKHLILKMNISGKESNFATDNLSIMDVTSKYTTGTVDVTNLSKIFTFTGATLVGNVFDGDYFRITSVPNSPFYRINDPTTIGIWNGLTWNGRTWGEFGDSFLKDFYQEETLSGQTFEILTDVTFKKFKAGLKLNGAIKHPHNLYTMSSTIGSISLAINGSYRLQDLREDYILTNMAAELGLYVKGQTYQDRLKLCDGVIRQASWGGEHAPFTFQLVDLRKNLDRKFPPNKITLSFSTGGKGYVFDGTGDYLNVPAHADWDIGTSADYTMELFANIQHATAQMYLMSVATNAGIQISQGKQLEGPGGIVKTWNYSTNTWYHIAASRASGTLRLFVDGVQIGADISDSTNIGDAINPLRIGCVSPSTQNFFNGYVDEIRFSNSARYTSNFTPPTTEFTSDDATKLLIHCGETKEGASGSGATFTDSGGTGHTVTEVGNAIESTTYFKTLTYSFSQAAIGNVYPVLYGSVIESPCFYLGTIITNHRWLVAGHDINSLTTAYHDGAEFTPSETGVTTDLEGNTYYYIESATDYSSQKVTVSANGVKNGTTYFENAGEVIENLVTNYSGLAASQIDTELFGTAKNKLKNWKLSSIFNGSGNNESTIFQTIQKRLSPQLPIIPVWKNEKYGIIVIDLDNPKPVLKLRKGKNIIKLEGHVSDTDVEKLHNSFELNYGYNPRTQKFTKYKKLSSSNSELLQLSENRYGLLEAPIINAIDIQDDNTADKLLAFKAQLLSEAFLHVHYRCAQEAYIVEEGDFVTVTDSEHGWTDKLFICVEREFTMQSILLHLIETRWTEST